MFNLGEPDQTSLVPPSTPPDVPLVMRTIGDALATPTALSCVIAGLVAGMIVIFELRREASWAGMRTGAGWTVAVIVFDAVFASIAAIAVFNVADALLPIPVSWVAALLTGVTVGCAWWAVSAWRLSSEGRLRLTGLREFLVDQVKKADARNESKYVTACAKEISDLTTVESMIDRAIPFVIARGRQGMIAEAHKVVQMLKDLRRDRESTLERHRTLVQVLLDHDGREMVNDLLKDARKQSDTGKKSGRGRNKAAAELAPPVGTEDHDEPAEGKKRKRKDDRGRPRDGVPRPRSSKDVDGTPARRPSVDEDDVTGGKR
jgi:hypothetical protein